MTEPDLEPFIVPTLPPPTSGRNEPAVAGAAESGDPVTGGPIGDGPMSDAPAGNASTVAAREGAAQFTDTAPSAAPAGATEPEPAPKTDQSHAPVAELTHQRADGAVHMVDVSTKAATKRTATATATLNTREDVIALLVAGELPKGEAIAVARVAGIMAAKQTSFLIPLCHPLPISSVNVELTHTSDAVRIEATVSTTGVTGVEMEALTSASITALSLYDMIKAVDKHASITDIHVLSKSGGKSGDWERP